MVTKNFTQIIIIYLIIITMIAVEMFYLWHNKNDAPYLTQEYINFTHIKHKFALSAAKNTKNKQNEKKNIK